MKSTLYLFLFLAASLCHAQSEYQITTSDIANFWAAYDSLETAESNSDSINIMQEQYLDKASLEFKEFIRIRNLTASEYVKKIGLYPEFWRSIRENTKQIQFRKSEVAVVLGKLEQELPNFKKPRICFAIGCLRTGGTISNDMILIGSEIASADQSVDVSELSGWLKSIIGKTGDITSMVAHETIHIQQINQSKYNLLTGTMNEGIADFITALILDKNINATLHQYGLEHECTLQKEFLTDLKIDPKDYSNWIYNGSRSKDKPADLGYFIGYRIAEAYYNKQADKQKALTNLLDHKKYKRISRKSEYFETGCQPGKL